MPIRHFPVASYPLKMQATELSDQKRRDSSKAFTLKFQPSINVPRGIKADSHKIQGQ